MAAGQGKVYLIGAGPGDPGLLTLKGREILSRADVVVFDYLANKAFLAFCRREAELVYAGKQGGDHTLSQEAINALLAERAGSGKTVARLKGGDPYVFGRGAEEAEVLVEAGIDFEVVPGVTSAVAAPAYAGIPLTHRRFASSVTFITGHEDAKKTASVHDWKALASGASTLVFFMGVKNLPSITANLLESGLAATTPAALVRWGTTCLQQSLESTLGSIAERARETGFKPPALLVVGGVVGLRDRLQWFERRPLLGRGLVVTRAREQASALVQRLEALGACCFEFPTIEIEPITDTGPIQEAIKALAEVDWLVFTSVNGVIHFWTELAKAGRDTRALSGCRVAAIGPATARALRERGLEPEFVPDKYVAEEVVQGLLDHGVRNKRVLIPRAEQAREILPRELEAAGAKVEVLPVYRTVLAEQGPEEILEALEGGRIHCITFTSSSTVENFFRLLDPEILRPYVEAGLELACIGPITAGTLKGFGFEAGIMPREYTIPGLSEAVAEKLQRAAPRGTSGGHSGKEGP